jgi:glyoxylase-like metal-dependent hydrolase (beta-lactamase superfamily II)
MIIQPPVERVSARTVAWGNGHFRHYYVSGDPAVLVECGVSASARGLVSQLSEAGLPAPGRLLAMHAHFDHVCGIPVLRRYFPKAEVLSSPAAARILKKPKVVAGFFEQDRKMKASLSGEDPTRADLPAPAPERISVDRTVQGGDRIPLGGGKVLELIEATGHSPCGLAAWLPQDRVLFVSDSLGFQISDSEIFPIFFHAYRNYIDTIQRLAAYPAEVLAFPHERIWRGAKVKSVFERALSAAREIRHQIGSELERGRDEADLKQALFDRYYRGNLRIYTPENIRLCVDLLVRRSMENG